MIKVGDVSWTGGREMCVPFGRKKLKGKDHLKDLEKHEY
jgi:hypothetical protein